MRLRSGSAYEAAGAAARNVPALPHEVLVRIFSLLPQEVLAVTPGRVSPAWAAAKAEAWAAVRDTRGSQPPYLPSWYIRSTFEQAPEKHQQAMMMAAVFHGDLDILPFMHACRSFCTVGEQARELATSSGRGVSAMVLHGLHTQSTRSAVFLASRSSSRTACPKLHTINYIRQFHNLYSNKHIH
jgi:hypothetical protein